MIRKIILIIGILALVLFMAVIGAAWYMGAFSSVDIKTEIRGPYNFICLEHVGAYHLIAAKIEKVRQYLDSKQIPYLHSAGMYFDDPAKVSEIELRSQGGYLIPDSVLVDIPFQFIKIKKRKTAVAAINAHPMIAPFKVYSAFHEWLENQNDSLNVVGAPLELYLPSNRVEVEFPLE
ncbi:hypothetical protein ACFLSX_05820 [Calditrichota bacterium]